MSESLYKAPVPEQLLRLADLAEKDCSQFKHEILNSSVTFNGPGAQDILNLTTVEKGGLIIVGANIRADFDITDTTLVPAGTAVPDLRATDSLNPYGPFAGGTSAVATLEIFQNGTTLFGPFFDIALTLGFLFAFKGETAVRISANPLQPAGKKIQLVSAFSCFSVDEDVVTGLQKKNVPTFIRKAV